MMCRSTSDLSLWVWMQFSPNYLITMTAHITTTRILDRHPPLTESKIWCQDTCFPIFHLKTRLKYVHVTLNNGADGLFWKKHGVVKKYQYTHQEAPLIMKMFYFQDVLRWPEGHLKTSEIFNVFRYLIFLCFFGEGLKHLSGETSWHFLKNV